MNKLSRRTRFISLIVIAIELLGLIVFSTLYFANFFDLQSTVKPEYIIFGSIGIIFIDCIFVWIVTIIFSSVRKRNDLKAAQVIGSDIQEAYNFAMVGLAVTDEDNIVLWTNDLFEQRHINILDQNILSWKPELRSLKESYDANATVKIYINSKTYDVKLLKEAGLYIFKDNSQYEDLFSFSQKQAPVVGLLSIDNYNDVIKNEEDFNDPLTKVKNAIFAFAKEYSVLIKRYRNDTYFLLLNYETLCAMRDDNFSILAAAREAGKGETVPLTLSLGLAYQFPDVVKLNNMAEEALSIAMSRGGDQVVLSRYGSEMEFFGGKTETQEKRNRVKVRVVADSLIGLIKASQNVIVMGHTQMDMDAFGACLGIRAICERVEKDCKIVVDIRNTELKTRGAMLSKFTKEELDDLIVSIKDADSLLKSTTLLIVVDVHIPSMVMMPTLLDKAAKIVVIDHHRRAEDYIEAPVLNYIDSSASSSSEIITQFISFATINPKIVLPPLYATIMLSGMYLDSSYFKSKSTGIHSFEAASFLKEYGADTAEADDLLKDDIEEYTMINHIITSIQTPMPGISYIVADDQCYDRSTLAKVANTCLTFKGVNAVFIFGLVKNGEYRLSARSNGTINVQLLVEKLGGGGHFTAAAAVFTNTSKEELVEKLLKVLETSLNEARADNEEEK